MKLKFECFRFKYKSFAEHSLCGLKKKDVKENQINAINHTEKWLSNDKNAASSVNTSYRCAGCFASICSR